MSARATRRPPASFRRLLGRGQPSPLPSWQYRSLVEFFESRRTGPSYLVELSIP